MAEALREVEKLDRECKEMKHELFRLSWYMRGAMSLDEAFGLCFEDREIIAALVKENLTTTKESGMPFF